MQKSASSFWVYGLEKLNTQNIGEQQVFFFFFFLIFLYYYYYFLYSVLPFLRNRSKVKSLRNIASICASSKGVLHLLQKIACFVLYLKIFNNFEK